MSSCRLWPTLAIASIALGTSFANAQSPEPSGPHTSNAWQIWAYSTAAPSFIAADATIIDGANMEGVCCGEASKRVAEATAAS